MKKNKKSNKLGKNLNKEEFLTWEKSSMEEIFKFAKMEKKSKHFVKVSDSFIFSFLGEKWYPFRWTIVGACRWWSFTFSACAKKIIMEKEKGLWNLNYQLPGKKNLD